MKLVSGEIGYYEGDPATTSMTKLLDLSVMNKPDKYYDSPSITLDSILPYISKWNN